MECNYRDRLLSEVSWLAINISLGAGAISVNQLNKGCTIAVGENSQPGWSQKGKHNYANCQNIGINVQTEFFAIVFDKDVIDNRISGIKSFASLQNQMA
ncbi:hypothetical protein C7121_06870 [Paenibacillus glucanolyticus]|jgi:hypothetical protein|nr:hypothetical protein A3958_08935 [Paenibacillus glucanolyticus]AVV55879.1 hypothetical protein C7121_06870 [Paenibacillus glucanolyticus]ETT38490.1 hypothetical protein C169_12797 [Paenibacillus sp. FSL R5-808]MPY19317.1 hypothetical protein [Paenibacillus glucanolyticus]